MPDPLWINVDSSAPAYAANELRTAHALPLQYDGRAVGARKGVRPGGTQLQVTLSGSDILVAPGVCCIDPAWTTEQGPYWGSFASETNVDTLTPADLSDPRVDRVWARVFDHDFDSSGRRELVLEYEAGIADPSPSAPAIPQGAIPLARIDVPADGQGSPAVTDERQYTVAGPVVLIYEADDTFTKADHPWARVARVPCQGPGAAGGGRSGDMPGSAGSGGGAGEYRESWLDVGTLESSVPITVGTGGSGVSGANGQNGSGPTSFGSHVVANPGSGGTMVSTGGTSGAVGGAGGIGGTGQIAIPGGRGDAAAAIASLPLGYGGRGGSSVLGHGGGSRIDPGSTGSGHDGVGYGSGGGGAAGAPSDGSGGNGRNGICIVELH